MASRKGINISGYYFVSIEMLCLFIYICIYFEV